MASNQQQRFSCGRGRALMNDIDEVERTLPPGFRFRPVDEEIIEDYLWPKANGCQPYCCPIREADVYAKSPKKLIEDFPTLIRREKWYFFTSTKKKYANGTRPDRSAGKEGYWKATGKNPKIKVKVGDKVVTANKRSLTFMEGPPRNGIKTNWLMIEYTLDNPPQTTRDSSHSSRMKLDDCVLCIIYHSKNGEEEDEEDEEEDDEEEAAAAANININSTAININPQFPANMINHSVSINPSFCYDQSQSSMNIATNLGYEGQQMQMQYDFNNYYQPSILQLDGESNPQPSQGVNQEIYHAGSELSQLPYPNYLNNEQGMPMELSVDDYLVSPGIMDQQVEGGFTTNNYDNYEEWILYETMEESIHRESRQFNGGAGGESSGFATSSSSRPQQQDTSIFPFGLEH